MFLLIDNLIIYISDELIETLCSAPGSPDTKALFFLFYEQVQIIMTAGQSEAGILVT